MNDLILSPEALEFISNARVLELSHQEAIEVCNQHPRVRQFWPVSLDEATLIEYDRALNDHKSSPAYDADQARRASQLELNRGGRHG